MPGRHRRVRGEDDLPRDAAPRFVKADSFALHPLPDHFQASKRAVPLVQMQNARHDAQGLEGPHAADAQQQFLANADALVAAVQPGGQVAIFRRIAVDVGIEQIQRCCGRRSPATRGQKAARCAFPSPP